MNTFALPVVAAHGNQGAVVSDLESVHALTAGLGEVDDLPSGVTAVPCGIAFVGERPIGVSAPSGAIAEFLERCRDNLRDIREPAIRPHIPAGTPTVMTVVRICARSQFLESSMQPPWFLDSASSPL
ncbi:hypothetical protein ACWEK5_07340 [Rhodococcus koreensis]